MDALQRKYGGDSLRGWLELPMYICHREKALVLAVVHLRDKPASPSYPSMYVSASLCLSLLAPDT